MPRCKESSQVNKLDSSLSESNDIIRLEVDQDDAVSMKPRHDGQGFIDGLFEFFHPLGLITAGGSLRTPRFEVLALKVFHRNKGVLLIIIDVRPVIGGHQRSQILSGQNVFEIGQFEAEAYVRAIADLVGFPAA